MLKQPLPKQEPIGLLLAVARRRFKQAVGDRARPFGLSPQQFWSVVLLRERAGISLGDLALRHRMDEPTASRVVAALTRRGLVSCQVDPGDRRRCALRLTGEGSALAGELYPLALEVRRAAVRGFTATERKTLGEMLHRVIANMDRLAQAGQIAPAGAARALPSPAQGRRRR